jgi:hypothetical protein
MQTGMMLDLVEPKPQQEITSNKPYHQVFKKKKNSPTEQDPQSHWPMTSKIFLLLCPLYCPRSPNDHDHPQRRQKARFSGLRKPAAPGDVK